MAHMAKRILDKNLNYLYIYCVRWSDPREAEVVRTWI